MKKIILAILPISILLSSCSDNLTKSKAKSIIMECMKKNPNKPTTDIKIGEGILLKSDTTAYKKLAQEGYLNLEKAPKERMYIFQKYNISVTDKAKPFLEETTTDGWYTKIAKMRICDIEVDKIEEIFEIPNENKAEVKISFKAVNKTPFWEISKDKSDFEIIKIPFRKTSDGWKGCD